MAAKKMSKEVVHADESVEKHATAPARMRDTMQDQFGVLTAGDVEIMKSVTIQVVDFHPVTTSIGLRLPIDRGETPNEAIKRVLGIVEEELTDAVGQACDDGLEKYWAKAKKRR